MKPNDYANNFDYFLHIFFRQLPVLKLSTVIFVNFKDRIPHVIRDSQLEKLLINKKYKLEKQPGKGGWTYVVITEIPDVERGWFGLVRVSGTIDDFELKGYNLMPMGKGKLFLPVKAEIRKKIGKSEGDWVQLTLYADQQSMDIPTDLLLCLEDEPVAHHNFLQYSETEKRQFIDWIFAAKTEDTKIERMAQTVNMALKGQKLNNKK